MNLLTEIERTKAKRDQYMRLGKRHQALLEEAELRRLKLRQFRHEEMLAQIDGHFAAIAEGDLDAAQEVYR